MKFNEHRLFVRYGRQFPLVFRRNRSAHNLLTLELDDRTVVREQDETIPPWGSLIVDAHRSLLGGRAWPQCAGPKTRNPLARVHAVLAPQGRIARSLGHPPGNGSRVGGARPAPHTLVMLSVPTMTGSASLVNGHGQGWLAASLDQ